MKSKYPAVPVILLTAVVFALGQSTPRSQPTTSPADESGMPGARSEVYKKVGDVSLRLHIFYPDAHGPEQGRPAIVFFFGGGWLRGSARQFADQCRYLASRGMVAITADYRVYERHQAKVVDCVADAEAAIRWVRANAGRLGIDPERIAASGGSAGGHLAAATATLNDFTETPAPAAVSYRPNALILFNPALDLTSDRLAVRDGVKKRLRLEQRLGAEAEALSPMDHVRPGLPPTLIFHGKDDVLIPYAQMEAFKSAMAKAGNRCELVGFAGEGHGFFNFGKKGNKYFAATLRQADVFLASLGYLKGEPTIDDFLKAGRAEEAGQDNSRYLQAVRTFADNVLRYGRDVYGPEHTPLLVDGINVDTHEPAVWKLPPQKAEAWQMPSEWILSNLASQQHLFKVLVALTDLTGDPKYKQAAVEATRYAFDHLCHESGLLFWGGHDVCNLATKQPVGESRSGPVAGRHELKCNLPFYELMWEVDRGVTQRFIEAFWSNHILQWDILDMNRHGPYQSFPPDPWDERYVGGPVPFVGEGLTFLNTACDLIYAAVMLHQFTGDERPLLWAKRLAQRYADVRHPGTGLGADNYSVLTSHRIQKQFEPEFGDRITEASFASLYGLRYSRAAICQMKLYERLGTKGEEFKRWAVEDLTAFAKHGYDPQDNSFWPMIIDGTKLTPADRKRDGYISTRWLEKRPATGIHFWAYALAYKLTRDPLMWRTARSIGLGIGLGDIGETPDASPALNLETSTADDNAVFGLLELSRATRNDVFLALARRVGDNLLQKEFHKGFFVEDADHVFCKCDDITPLALLHLYVAVGNVAAKLPEYAASNSYFHCHFDGKGRTYDNDAIYGLLRQPEASASRPAVP